MNQLQYLEKLLQDRKLIGQNIDYLHRLDMPDKDFIESEAKKRYDAIDDEYRHLAKEIETGTINPHDSATISDLFIGDRSIKG